MKETRLGSHPDSYVALAMPSTIEGSESMLRMMKTSIQKKFQAQPLLLEALDQHKQATHLICNPRFAALLFKRIAEYHRVEVGRRLFTSRLLALTCLDTHHAPPAHSCLDTHIVQVARDFRRVNAMSSKDQDGVAECYTLALALLFRPAEDGTPLSVDERALFSSAGVLTDRSRWHRSGNLLPLDYVRVEGSEYDDGLETMILIAPKRGNKYCSAWLTASVFWSLPSRGRVRGHRC